MDDSELVVGAKWERPLGTVALPLGKVPGVLATTTDPAAPLRLHQDFCESGPQAEMAARVSPEVEYQMAQAAHNESPQRHGDQHEGLGGPNSATKCALKAAPKCGTKSGHTGNVPPTQTLNHFGDHFRLHFRFRFLDPPENKFQGPREYHPRSAFS